jgi:hypothetical protein
VGHQLAEQKWQACLQLCGQLWCTHWKTCVSATASPQVNARPTGLNPMIVTKPVSGQSNNGAQGSLTSKSTQHRKAIF